MDRLRFSMTRLHIYFFRGLITILPVALTVYLLYLFLTWSEDLAVSVLRPFIGEFYFPGLGLALGVLVILTIGFLVSKRSIRVVFQFIERPFTNIPVIKSIYSSLKSFADYFSPTPSATAQQVVVVRHPDQPIEMVGLITRQGVDNLPDGFLQGDRVAVYLPMSYMIGGYTVFVPTDWVTPIEMSVEEAMRSSLIAWMAGQDRTAVEADPEDPLIAAQAQDAAAMAPDNEDSRAPQPPLSDERDRSAKEAGATAATPERTAPANETRQAEKDAR